MLSSPTDSTKTDHHWKIIVCKIMKDGPSVPYVKEEKINKKIVQTRIAVAKLRIALAQFGSPADHLRCSAVLKKALPRAI